MSYEVKRETFSVSLHDCSHFVVTSSYGSQPKKNTPGSSLIGRDVHKLNGIFEDLKLKKNIVWAFVSSCKINIKGNMYTSKD